MERKKLRQKNEKAKRQRDSILSALGIQQQVEQAKHSKQIISSALALLVAKSAAKQEQLTSVYKTADILQNIAENKLSDLQKELDSELRKTIESLGDIENLRLIHKEINNYESLTPGQKEYYSILVETKIDRLAIEEGKRRVYG